MIKNNYYKINKELVSCGWKSDETGVYVPYTFKKEDNPDPRNVYLKISRLPSEDSHFEYAWVKQKDGYYFKLSKSVIGDNPVNAEEGRFINKLVSAGTHATLDSEKGCYKNFYLNLKDNISQYNCLGILKEDYYEFNVEYPQKVGLTTEEIMLDDLNTRDMREIASKVIDDSNLVKHYNNSYRPYDHYICPWHDDKKPSAMAYEQLFVCTSTNCDVGKLDQEAFIKKAYGLKTIGEVVIKYVDLFY